MPVIRLRTMLFPIILALAWPAPAFAYMGPGIGVGAIGAALGIVVSLLLVLISLVWYPLKRLGRRMRGRPVGNGTARRRDGDA
jgi:hypothetical protein